MNDLKHLIADVSRVVATLDLTDTAKAEIALNDRFPPDGPIVTALQAASRSALAGGTICQMEKDGIRFSRVVKPKDDAGGCSVDAVLMDESVGPPHTHLRGEVCLCMPEAGTPAFDGRTDPWVVMPTGSRHAPTVTGGRMLILYWWPEGAVQWG